MIASLSRDIIYMLVLNDNKNMNMQYLVTKILLTLTILCSPVCAYIIKYNKM